MNVRDIEVIDCELRLLAAFRRMAREGKGRPPSTARIDELLDERLTNFLPDSGELKSPKPMVNSSSST